MIARRLLSLIAPTAALLFALDGFAGTPASPAPGDLAAFVKQLPPPGARDRAFLDIPSPLLKLLAIDPAAIRGVDPGLVCDASSKAANMFQASLGKVGQVNTVCTPAGWSQGVLALADGSSYVTTCGDASGSRVTANLDVSVGAHSLHASADSAASGHAPSHDCTGWRKVDR